VPARPLRPLPLAALAIACALALVAGYLVFVRTHAGQRLDEAVLDGRLASEHARHAASVLLTTISVGSVALALVVLVGQALLRRRGALAVVTVVVVLGALLLTEVLKHVLVRPDFVFSSIDHNSFPSGHTTAAFAVGIAAALAAPPRWRRTAAVGALLYGTAIGVATIAAGWHRPSDVGGAMLVVTGWAAAVVLAVSLVDRHAFVDEGDALDRLGSTWVRAHDLEGYVLLAVLALVAGWVLTVAIVGGRRIGAIELTNWNAAFLAACACVAALAALLLATLLTVLRESLPARRG
jgi:membrane-associated phospholipid phosphatase